MSQYYYNLVTDPDFDDDFPQVNQYTDEEYIQKMQNVLGAYPNIGVPREPTSIAPFVYLGNSANAENISLIKRSGFKYILNCAGSGSGYAFRRYKDMYTAESGVMGYQELLIDDTEYSSIRPYFERAHAFIDYAVMRQAKVLIFCPGVSRSGAIALSYMLHKRTALVQCTRELKDNRRVVLTNDNFMKELVSYARENHLLDGDMTGIRAPRFGRKVDMHRINRAHLPMYLQ